MGNEFTPEKKVVPYEPKSLENKGVRIGSFQPKEIRVGRIEEYDQAKKHFGAFANTDPEKGASLHGAHFQLHPESKRLLGVDREERNHLEGIIQQEVEQRLETFRVDAYQEGFSAGMADGKREAEQKAKESMEPMLKSIESLLLNFEGLKQEIYSANEKVLIDAIFTIAKEVTLSELKTDTAYLKRLCGLLVEKLGVKDSVKIKVARSDLAKLDELKEFLKAQWPELKNLQIEATDEIELGGCKVETDLIKVNATVENQFKAIRDSILGEQ